MGWIRDKESDKKNFPGSGSATLSYMLFLNVGLYVVCKYQLPELLCVGLKFKFVTLQKRM
jgi:hypothetical protein